MNPWEWTTADIMMGRMIIAGPRQAQYCPECHSANVRVYSKYGTPFIKCNDCGVRLGGASAMV
jgi:uncharacterized protein (DUF983 family)